MDTTDADGTVTCMRAPRFRRADLLLLPPTSVLAVFVVAAQLRYAFALTGIDLGVYLRGGKALLEHVPLYTPSFAEAWVTLGSNGATSAAASLPFTYPPFAALLFAPLSLLGYPSAILLFTMLGVMAASSIAHITVTRYLPNTGRFSPTGLTLALTMILLGTTAVFESMRLGQLSLLLTALVLVDLHSDRPGRRTGVLVGIAAAVKLLPGIVIVYWALTRQWRKAITATVTTAICWIVAVIAAPQDSIEFFSRFAALDARGQGDLNPYNLAVSDTLSRLVGHTMGTAVATVIALGVLAVGAAGARRWFRTGDELAGGLTMVAAVSLASPVGWVHYTMWALPAVAIACSQSSRRLQLLALPVAAVALSVPFRQPALESIGNSLSVLAVYGAFAALVLTALRATKTTPAA